MCLVTPLPALAGQWAHSRECVLSAVPQLSLYPTRLLPMPT